MVVSASSLSASPCLLAMVVLCRSWVVSVEVELQPEGAPGGYAQVAEAELGVDEIEVVMEALAAVADEVGLPGLLVVPRLVGGAHLETGGDVNQSRMGSALLDDGLDAFFLAYTLGLAQVLDGESVCGGNGFGVGADAIAPPLRPLRVVEDAYPCGVEETGHAGRVTDLGQGAVDDHPVVAGHGALDLSRVPIEKRCHGCASLRVPCVHRGARRWKTRCGAADWANGRIRRLHEVTMGNIRSFKELKVWQRAMDAAMEIFRHPRECPSEERFSLTDQIRRSSRSVPANRIRPRRSAALQAHLVVMRVPLDLSPYFARFTGCVPHLSQESKRRAQLEGGAPRRRVRVWQGRRHVWSGRGVAELRPPVDVRRTNRECTLLIG